MSKIRDALITQKRELELTRQKRYIPRNVRLSSLDKDIIKVIIGPRRAGKSFFAIHEMNKSDNYGYVNFDDERLVEITQYDDIIETINSLYNHPRLLLLDEIQNLPKWELFVNRLQRQGFNLVITGSNSNLLSSELSTHLTGRYVESVVFPFSFREYLDYFGPEATTSEIKVRLDQYLRAGGYPEPLVKEIEYSDYLRTLHDSIIFKDIVNRYNIRYPRPMNDLSRYLFSNPGSPLSYRKLTGMVGVKSTATVMKYIDYFEEAFLIFQVNAFSVKYREQVRAAKKVYPIDNGMIAANAFNFTPNSGVLMENITAADFKRNELEGKLDLFYFKSPQGYEIDFVVKQGLEITGLYQVCYNLDNEKTKTREIRALLHGAKHLRCKNLTVITGDYEGVEEAEWYGIKGTVHFVPLWKHLQNFSN